MKILFGSDADILRKLKAVPKKRHDAQIRHLEEKIEKYRVALMALAEAGDGAVVLAEERVINELSSKGPIILIGDRNVVNNAYVEMGTDRNVTIPSIFN